MIDEIARKLVIAVAMNCYYDHAGGWHSFLEHACHPLEVPELLTLDAEQAAVGDFLIENTLWAWPPENPREYCASIRRMRALPVYRVYAGHYGTMNN